MSIGWNSSKINSRLVSLGLVVCSPSIDPTPRTYSSPKGTSSVIIISLFIQQQNNTNTVTNVNTNEVETGMTRLIALTVTPEILAEINVNVNHEFLSWLKQPKLLQSPQ